MLITGFLVLQHLEGRYPLGEIVIQGRSCSQRTLGEVGVLEQVVIG